MQGLHVGMQIKGVPFSKLQGSHDPEDRTHHDQAGILKRRNPRESLQSVPADPGVMVIPSGTRQVPRIACGSPPQDADAAEVLRLDEDPGGSARSSLPSRPGSRAGLDRTSHADASLASISVPSRPGSRAGLDRTSHADASLASISVPSRPGSRAGLDDVGREGATGARDSLSSRPGSSAGPKVTSTWLSGSIASIPESGTSPILPADFGNMSASQSGFRQDLESRAGLTVDEDGGLVSDDIYAPVTGPEVMSMSAHSDLDSPTSDHVPKPNHAEFSFFRRSESNAPDPLDTRSVTVMDSRQHSESAEGDVLAGFRKSSSGEPPRRSNDRIHAGGADGPDQALSEPLGRMNSSSQHPGSSMGISRQSDADDGQELGPASAAIGSSTLSASLGESSLRKDLTAADTGAVQTLDIRDRPGSSSGAMASTNSSSTTDLGRSSTTAGVDALHAALRPSRSSSGMSGDVRLDGERQRRSSRAEAAPALRPQFDFAQGSRSDLPRPGTAATAGGWGQFSEDFSDNILQDIPKAFCAGLS